MRSSTINECLKSNNTLTCYIINYILEYGIVSIGKALQRNTSLCILDISGNRLSDEGVLAFVNIPQRKSYITSTYNIME